MLGLMYHYFLRERAKKIEMLTGLGLPQEVAEECSAADFSGVLSSGSRSSAHYCLSINEGADMEELSKHLRDYCTQARAIKGVLIFHGAFFDDDRTIRVNEVLTSPDALDDLISTCFSHYAKMLDYCDPKSLEMTVMCPASMVKYFKNRLSTFGPAMLLVLAVDEDEPVGSAEAEAEAGPSSSFASLTLQEQQPNDSVATNTGEDSGGGGGGEGGSTAVRCLHAEEQAFDIHLIRKLILSHKIALERNIRTDRDIHKAVKKWLEDPEAAERQFCHISDWDVSRVTNMSRLFCTLAFKTNPQFNEDLSRWQVGNVTNMSWMFNGAFSFTSDLSGWETGSVTDMSHMFNGALDFTSDLSGWQTDKVTDMSGMFAGASCFNSDLSGWQTDNVTNMSGMFHVALSFKSDLSKWQTGKVTNMRMMFAGASSLQEKPLWYG